jgi:hypothetical protein
VIGWGFSAMDTCTATANSLKDYEARKSIGFIDKELARWNVNQTNEMLK